MSQLQLDKSTIQSYGVALSEKLVNEFYTSKEVIKGDEIIRFTEIEQLNFFVLMNLFDRWKDEINRFKSPYFNYEDEEVALALKTFVNKASRNISVRKEFLKPLVQKAIVDTLTYLLNPIDFISEEILKADSITKTDLGDKDKFFKLYKDTFQLWLEKINLSTSESITAADALAAYKAVAPIHHTVLYSDPVVDKFNQLLKLALPVAPSQQASVEKLFKNAPESKKPVASDVASKNSDNMLNEQFSKPRVTTINDNLKQTTQAGNSIAERLSKSKIEDIKSSIPLNLKFLFINTLFDGKVNEYNDALAHIEECSDFDTTKQVLREKYSTKNKWDKSTEECAQFFQIIERKFY
jgi:hypothetical protein